MIDSSRTKRILEKLIAFPTVSRDSNLAMIDWIEAFLVERGFACYRLPDQSGQKAGIFAGNGPEGDGGILLSAHTDVVPVEGQNWQSDPFRLTESDSRLYGRGACDMKGFLACALSAADSASRMALSEPLKLSISYDEEIGCVGIANMIPHLASTIGLPRFCIVGEPTSMKIVIGHKGKAIMRASCRGTGGHSSMAPRFMNALYLATDLVTRIRSIQENHAGNCPRDEDYAVPFSTLHIGRMTGGTALNIVPDHAVIDFELRHLAQDRPQTIIDSVRDEARRIVSMAQEKHPESEIAIEVLNAYPALETAADAEIVGWISSFLDRPEIGKVDFGTEAGCFAKLGVPSVVCGPGSIDQAHKADEFIEVAELRKCDQMLSHLLLSLDQS